MLKCLRHPCQILLCDVYHKRDDLVKIYDEIKRDLAFQGSVRIIESKQKVPPEFYDATLIIGATNAPEVLDISRVNPGTLLVDDSAPHCFSIGDTVRRFQKQNDILFTEGGSLRSPQVIQRLRYLPRFVEQKADPSYVKAVRDHDPFQTTGCVLSSLLSSRFRELNPTVGFVDENSCFQHYEVICTLGFQAADPHCGSYVLPGESVRNFRRRFGGISEHTSFPKREDRFIG